MKENSDNQIIKTIGENGEEIYMKLQEVVNVDNKEYALLSLADENKNVKAEDELVIMRMKQTDEECTFEIIESDEEFNFVVQAIREDDEEDIEE